MMLSKIINITRTTTFAITLLTTVPLFINYLQGKNAEKQLIVDLHVWFGIAFFVSAIISMRMSKSNKRQ